MKIYLKQAAVTVAALAASAAPVFAQAAPSRWWWNPRPPVTSVPEIDATTGVLAIAAVLAVLAFVVERRRRAA